MKENFTGKNILIRMKEEVEKLQESTNNRNIISCANETNEDNDNNLGNLINGDKTQTLPLVQTNASDYTTHHKKVLQCLI